MKQLKLVIWVLIVLAIARFVIKPGSPKSPIAEITTETPVEDTTTETGTVVSKEIINETEISTSAKIFTLKPGSQLLWACEKVWGAHNGYVNISEWFVEVDDNQIVWGKFIMDMTSLKATDIDDQKLDNHLKSDDFFGVNDNPTAEFIIKKVEDKKITGNFTLKGITEELTFDASNISISDEGVVTQASFAIDRTIWGIDGGLPAVSEFIELEFDLQCEPSEVTE